MMAAKPFKQELLNYPWPPSSAIKAHGKRWIDACEVNPNQQEEVWQRVSRAIPDLSPTEFIKFVIRARSRAVGFPAFLAQASREPTAEEIKQRIKRALNSKKTPSDIADLLETAAFSIRNREAFAEVYLEGLPSNYKSRKTDAKAQALRAFCLILGEFFKQRSDRWLDEVVPTLADIALDRKNEPTSIETVREFRKVRPLRATQH
jgi:hypothetical protein